MRLLSLVEIPIRVVASKENAGSIERKGKKQKSKPPTAVCFFSFLPSVSTMEHQKASPYLQAVLRLARGHANEEGGASTRSWSSARGGASASA